MPANFNDLRLNADVRLNPHPIEAKETAEFHRGERGGAAPRVRRQEDARAGDGGRASATEVDAQRLADAQRARRSRPSRSKCRRTGAPPWNSSRSTCRTGAIRARCGSIRPTPCRRTTPSISPWSAATRATRCSCRKPTDSRGLLYFKAALEAVRPIGLRDRPGHGGAGGQSSARPSTPSSC